MDYMMKVEPIRARGTLHCELEKMMAIILPITGLPLSTKLINAGFQYGEWPAESVRLMEYPTHHARPRRGPDDEHRLRHIAEATNAGSRHHGSMNSARSRRNASFARQFMGAWPRLPCFCSEKKLYVHSHVPAP